MRLKNTGNRRVFLAFGEVIVPGESITVKAAEGKVLLQNPHITEIKGKKRGK